MKGYNPINYTRQKWYDPKKVKNRSHTCNKSHLFCNFDYEWGTDTNKMGTINRPISSALHNINLPMPAQKIITVNYDSMTEQNLDDWVAQSINRNLGSMLNPQKKFFLPSNYDQDLKYRYRRNKEIKTTAFNETYFSGDKESQRKGKGYLSAIKKKKDSLQSLYFDYHKLQPHQNLIGTPIKIREKRGQKKQVRRRNAVLLSGDIHYARFLKQYKKEKNVEIGKVLHEPTPIQERQKIYSYNIESMTRKSCFEDVPNSLIEKQYQRIKEPVKDLLTSHRALITKQDELHQKYRIQMNEKTSSAILQIKQLANPQKNHQNDAIQNTQMIKKPSTVKQRNIQSLGHGEQSQPRDRKYLENRVLKLLNDMLVQSEIINENMTKLNIHVPEIFLQHPDSRPQTKWILKAQQKIKDNKYLLAIDCYKQAIILQPELFIPVFNIAVLLQKQNMLQSSRAWFRLASQFQTDSQNVIFGMSLVALKQLKFAESLADRKFREESTISLLLCSCTMLQIVRDVQISETRLQVIICMIIKQIKPTNFNVLPDFIFSVIFSQYRRIPLQFNCLSFMLFKETIFLILYQEQKKIKQNDQALVEIGEKLISSRFFCRFSLNLVKKLLEIALYEEKDKGEMIFSSKNLTSIIISGIVSMKSHEKQFNRPEIIKILTKGDIIGAGSLEKDISSKPNNWFIAHSKVEMITVKREQFEKFWNGQITFEMDFKYHFLKNVELFKGLAECTLFKICQLFEKKVYEKGTILFNNCAYRVQMLSKPGKGYGLGKNTNKLDIRMVYSSGAVGSKSKQATTTTTTKNNGRGRCRIVQLLKQHHFKFNEMKFNRTKYPGLFVIVKGIVELEDDRGFRCNGMISQRDFFGQVLVIQSDGYHNYGRLVAESEEVEVLLLDIEKLVWLFSEEDKNVMRGNCANRETIETIRFLRNRFSECQDTKLKYKFSN